MLYSRYVVCFAWCFAIGAVTFRSVGGLFTPMECAEFPNLASLWHLRRAVLHLHARDFHVCA